MKSYAEHIATSYAKILAARVKPQLRRNDDKLELHFGKRMEVLDLPDDPAEVARAIINAVQRLMSYEPEEGEK